MKKAIVLLSLTALLAVSCAKEDDEVSIELKVGEITELKVGETAINSQYSLSLRVDNVDDYRCPVGVDCMLAEDHVSLSVQIHLTTKNDAYSFTFVDAPAWSATPSNKAITIEGMDYHLEDVLPYPVSFEDQSIKTVKISVNYGVVWFDLN
jgi:hypothetical protein